MQKEYFFVLGRESALSYAELISIFNAYKFSYKLVYKTNKFAIIRSSNNLLSVFSRLGGTVKAGEILKNVNNIYSIIEYIISTRPRKLGISIYCNKNALQTKQRLMQAIKSKTSTHIVGKRNDTILNAASVYYNKLTQNNIEINVLGEDFKYIGITKKGFDFKSFRKRDYQKPYANKKDGMLPTKLSRIMVNLSDNGRVDTIWDPFCGSGNILLEAASMGFHTIGTDIQTKAIRGSIINLQWLKEKYNLSLSINQSLDNVSQYAYIAQHPVEKMHKVINNLPIRMRSKIAIVTEGYLGPVLKRPISMQKFIKISRQVNLVYQSLLKQILLINKIYKNAILSIVFVLPMYKVNNIYKGLQILQYIKRLRANHYIIPTFFSTKIASNLYWDRGRKSIIRRKIIVLHKEQ